MKQPLLLNQSPASLALLVALAAGCATLPGTDTRSAEWTGLTAATLTEPSTAAASAAATQPLTVAANSGAPSYSAPVQDDESWEFALVPYLWAVGLDGDVTVGGMKVPVDLGFEDILDDFAGGGSLFFDASRGDWSVLVDLTYVTMETADQMGPITVATDTSVGLYEIDGAFAPMTDSNWELIAGVRAIDVDVDVAITSMPPAGGSISSTQLVLGARGWWEPAERWNIGLRGDVGLGSSDSSWQALLQAGYEFGESWGLNFGYRIMGIDIEDGNAGIDATIDGLLLGAVFAW